MATGPCPPECFEEVRPGWFQPGRLLGAEPRSVTVCIMLVVLAFATHDKVAIVVALAVAIALILVFQKMCEQDPRAIEIRLRGLRRYSERSLRAEALVDSPVRQHERILT